MKRKGGWNQEVTDAQGRRRFHGAFTGGFSAGHFNTVGSEEGWQPSAFVSSRANRAQLQPRRAEDFMDEEDDPLLGKRLETSEAYDTLQQNERERLKAAASDAAARPRHHEPVFRVPDELILPTTGNSIGKKLLGHMGWKEGHGIGPRMRRRKLSIGSEDEETKDGYGDERDQDVFVPPRNSISIRSFPKPKIDKYGAGFDPYANAPEFLHHKLKQDAGLNHTSQRQVVTFAQALGGGKGTGDNSRVTLGFGLSALEENDDVEVYDTISMDQFDHAIAPTGEQIKLLDVVSNEAREQKRRNEGQSSAILCSDGRPALEGFRLALKKQKPPKSVIERLEVPSGFRAYHVFDEKDDASVVEGIYSEFNFSTEKTGRGSMITAAHRAAILREDDDTDGHGAITKRTGGSVFDLMDSAQRQKLMEAAQATRDRKPLTAGAPTEQFRANIMASISKRFVSSSSENTTVGTDEGATPKGIEKRSFRTESVWAPHVLLCKRFRVKCAGQTISSDASTNDGIENDLFTTELGPHLIDLAASRRGNTITVGAPIGNQSRPPDNEDLPDLPNVPKPSSDLLRSIFEPSDDSELGEEGHSERDDSDSDSEAGQNLPAAVSETVSKISSSMPQSQVSTSSHQLEADQSALLSSKDSESSEDSDSDTEAPSKRKKHHRRTEELKKRKKAKKVKEGKLKKSKKKKSKHSHREESSHSLRRERRSRSRSRSRNRDRRHKERDRR